MLTLVLLLEKCLALEYYQETHNRSACSNSCHNHSTLCVWMVEVFLPLFIREIDGTLFNRSRSFIIVTLRRRPARSVYRLYNNNNG